MRKPTRTSLLLLVLLACLVPLAAGNKKTGLFQRLARALQGNADGSSSLDTLLSDEVDDAVAGLTADPPRTNPLQDTWDMDEALTLAKQAFKGDTVGVLKAMVSNYQEGLKEIWSQPAAAKMLLDNFPVFQGIKGMRAIQQKEGPLTSEDVSFGSSFV